MHNTPNGGFSSSSNDGGDWDLMVLQAAALEATANAVVLTDRAGMVIWTNAAFERLTGYSSAEMLGQSTRLLKSGKNSAALYADMWQTIAGGSVWRGELINRRKDGSLYHEEMTVTPVQNGTGQITHYIAIKLDISERAQIRQKLDSLNERLSLATGAARMGVWEWDLTKNVFVWDVTLFEMYGFAFADELPYPTWAAAVYPEDLPAVEATFRAAVAENGQASVEFRVLQPGGVMKNISMMGRAVLDEQMDVIRLIGVSSDVTAQRAAEKEREERRRAQLQFKDEFLSHVSHELRSPLTAIKQFTSILLGGSAGALNKDQRNYQQIVMKNIRQLQTMIDDLLEVTRLEAGKLRVEPGSASVPDAVSDALMTFHLAAGGKGVTLSQSLPAQLPAAHADPTRLRQILIILLDNAMKATAAGGAVTIEAKLVPDPRRLQLQVSDTGCGMSPDTIEKLFERLYQAPGAAETARNGLGLGLYICKKLVTLQGGEVWVESQPGRGSTFFFTLPVVTEVAALAPSAPPLKGSVKSSKRLEAIGE